MKPASPSAAEIVSRGQRIYEEQLRAQLEPTHNGQIIVINIHTGEYEMDQRHITALNRARSRWPNEIFFSARIGFPTLGHIGSRFRARPESA